MLIIVFKGHFDRLSDHRIIVYSIKSYMLIRSQSLSKRPFIEWLIYGCG